MKVFDANGYRDATASEIARIKFLINDVKHKEEIYDMLGIVDAKEAMIELTGCIDSMTREALVKFKNQLATGSIVESLGGLQRKRVLSDKVGYDWLQTYVNGVLISQEYIEQEIKVGTENNPIQWYEGVEGINNAYYVKDGTTCVYMSGEFIEL